MAAAGDPKGFKQDMVVSVRYRNDLPPPPMPPKLLDIDTGGLAQYLTTSFASGIARREEPNIEVDAEGGMPIDMIGIPGYFLGDESAIMAPEIMPVLDPADHALMLTPDQLKNQMSKTSNVSFLRRTQYMTSQNARANDPLVRTNPRSQKSLSKRNSTVNEQLARDDKENIKRHILKGFDIAYPDSVQQDYSGAVVAPSTAAERDAWQNPVHPDNTRLKPVSYFPILPDFDSFTDSGGYTSIKFDKPPLPSKHGRRDNRVDVALLRDIPDQRQARKWAAEKEAFERDPERYEDPGPEPVVWTYHVPVSEGNASVSKIKRILNESDPNRDDSMLWNDLYDEEGAAKLEYEKVRTYPAATSQRVNSSRFLALSLFDPDTASENSRLKLKGKAAYYYSIHTRLKMRADRSKLGRAPQANGTDEPDTAEKLTGITLGFKEPSLQVQQARLYEKLDRDEAFREQYEEVTRLVEEEDEKEAEAREGAQQERDVEMDDAAANGSRESTKTNGMAVDDDDDADAEGEVDADAMEDD